MQSSLSANLVQTPKDSNDSRTHECESDFSSGDYNVNVNNVNKC